MTSPLTTLILLNLVGAGLLEPCLRSLLAQRDTRFQVVLIDQAAADGSTQAAIQRLGPDFGNRLQVIWAGRNLGFTGGANLGFSLAQTPYCALLNVDAEADPGWLEALHRTLEQAPDCGMVASQIRLYDPPGTLDNTGHLLFRDGLNLPRGRLGPTTTPFPTEVLCPSGCAALYRTEALRRIGGFEPGFFAYGEDLDLGLTLQALGYSCRYAPDAIVLHRLSHSLGRFSARKLYWVERNRLRVLIRHFPAGTILTSPAWSLLRYWASFRNLEPTRAPDASAGWHAVALAAAWMDGFLHLPQLLTQRRTLDAQAPGHTRVAEHWLRAQPVSLDQMVRASILRRPTGG